MPIMNTNTAQENDIALLVDETELHLDKPIETKIVSYFGSAKSSIYLYS
jgi:hypothetical protein